MLRNFVIVFLCGLFLSNSYAVFPEKIAKKAIKIVKKKISRKQVLRSQKKKYLWLRLNSRSLLRPKSLLVKLRQQENELDRYFSSFLSAKTNNLLLAYDEISKPSRNLLRGIIRDFNRMIFGSSIYDKTIFEELTLTQETKTLIKKKLLTKRMTTRLNRLLLGEAYPKEIMPLKQSIRSGSLLAKAKITNPERVPISHQEKMKRFYAMYAGKTFCTPLGYKPRKRKAKVSEGKGKAVKLHEGSSETVWFWVAMGIAMVGLFMLFRG